MRKRSEPVGTVAASRTVQQIRNEVEQRREEFERCRKEKETRQREAAERRAAEKRKNYLDEIAPREEQIWQEVVPLTEASRPSEYDRAVERPAFLKRLKKARLV